MVFFFNCYRVFFWIGTVLFQTSLPSYTPFTPIKQVYFKQVYFKQVYFKQVYFKLVLNKTRFYIMPFTQVLGFIKKSVAGTITKQSFTKPKIILKSISTSNRTPVC